MQLRHSYFLLYYINSKYLIPQTPIAVARQKLKDEFLKNKDVTDVRVIDMHVVKGML